MKAAWYEKNGEAKDVLMLGEIPTPEPGPGEVRVKIHVSGVNPSDVKSRRNRPINDPKIIPHSDAGGVVDAVGAGVSPSRIGERVWTWNAQYQRPFGTAAQYVCLPQAQAVTFCWGARHGGLFGDVDDFREAGIDVHLATLDGSIGHKGTVIDLLDNLFASGVPPTNDSLHIACCGPEGMMAAVSHWSSARQLPCDVSLEAPMACGIGICFTCVAKVRDASGAWDYRRTCIEGPIFDANRIEW